MPWYVYIIESQTDGTYYKGISEDYHRRLEEHNNGQSRYTSGKGPWELRYVEETETKRSALIREKMLKRQNSHYLRWFFEQETNLLKKQNRG